MVLVRSYDPSDNKAAGALLKAAFDDDPCCRCLNSREQWKTADNDFRWQCWSFHKSFGWADVASVDGKIACVGLWEPAQMTWYSMLNMVCMLFALWWSYGFSHVKRLIGIVMVMEKRRHFHAPTAYHLQVLGTDPSMQGKGVGSALIRRGLYRADVAGVPCYLESSNPRNVPFYKRHGFRVVEEFYMFENDPLTPGKGPVATLMMRHPKKDELDTDGFSMG